MGRPQQRHILHTMKPFIVNEMTLKDHSRSSAMSSFIRSPRFSIKDRKSKLHQIVEMTLKVNQGH